MLRHSRRARLPPFRNQVQELAPEQPQLEPDHSEMDTVIMACAHEIIHLEKE